MDKLNKLEKRLKDLKKVAIAFSGGIDTSFLLFYANKVLGTENVLEYHGSFKYSSPIWSHNDFLQILCGMGLLMFLCYVWQWIKLLVNVKKESFMSVLFVAILILVAFYNGLYIHTRLVFVIPLLLIFVKIRKQENLKSSYYLGDGK